MYMHYVGRKWLGPNLHTAILYSMQIKIVNVIHTKFYAEQYV